MSEDNARNADSSEDTLDEARLFEALCELQADAQARRLDALERSHPALASRMRRLLSIDEAYGEHTAHSVLTTEIPDPVADISDIGAFRLVRQIGRGGMGVVYLAERRNDFEQQVAIKIMPRFATDDPSRDRFAQERRILAQLRHPNICSILDGGELADGTPWLAMEYVPGESLCTWCDHNGSDLHTRIGLFLQLCDAVQYAHRNLVIHRDLKDSNVLVDEHGGLKLLDFGIAKLLVAAADAGQTAVQDRFFSPMTAAPEQVRGERATVAVDVYALGALLHQLLCGVLPFAKPHRDPAELQRAILEVVPPRMSEILQRETVTRVPLGDHAPVSPRALIGELDAIVAHCLRKDASERYAEVGDLSRDLRAWMSGHPISISNNDRLYRARKFLRRHRLAALLVTLTTASVLGALGMTLWQASELRLERDAAEQARIRSDIDRDRARAVADFMRQTFEQADPGRASEGGLLARELIERGKRRLDALAGQSDVQAELALLLAESDAGMGLIRESDATYAAYAGQIDALSVSDTGVRWRARTLRLSNQLQLDEDGPYLDTELSALAPLAITPKAHVDLARIRERLQVRRSEFKGAAKTLETAWQRYASALDVDDELGLRVDLGLAYLNVERWEDARRISDSIDRTALRKRDPALQIRALRLIARELQLRGTDRGALSEAIADWQRTAEALYGSDSLEAAKAYVWSVGVSTDTQEQDALMRKAYAIQTAKLPPVSTARAHAEYNIASFYLELRQRPDLAEPHLAQAVEIGRRVSSRAHADVRKFELSWAKTLNVLGRYRECQQRLSAPPGVLAGTSDPKRLSALHLELAKAAIALQGTAEARRELDAAYALWRELGTPQPPEDIAGTIRALERSLTLRADER